MITHCAPAKSSERQLDIYSGVRCYGVSVKRKEKGKPISSSVRHKNFMKIKVKEVMNLNPRTVDPDTSIDGLLNRLLGQIEDCFPVVDKNKRLIGIVTESDFLQVLHPQIPQALVGSALKEVLKSSASTVSEIMTTHPITTTPEMKIAEALNLMTAHKLRRLPVVEDGRLVGLLSLRGIIELYRVLK